MNTAGTLVLIAVVLLVGVAGLLVRARSGRVRGGGGADGGWALAGAEPAADDRVLLLQLSSPVCVPCRQTTSVLTGMAADEPGLRHVEVDVAERVDVARALGVLRTPTTIAFDRDGAELLRVSGVPRTDELRAALRDAADRAG